MSKLLTLTLISALCGLGTTACYHEHHDMHDAGQHMKNAGNEIGDAASDTAHSAGKAMEHAGEKIEDSTGNH